MNQNSVRSWKVLSWNVKGVNSSWKWDAIRNKILLSECDVVCLQETKKTEFDIPFLRKICPSGFDTFECLPSVGASGGILIAWKSALFTGEKIHSNEYGISVELVSLYNNVSWVLTCIYGPCLPEGKIQFVNWLKNVQMPDSVDWMILGDFNLMRSLEDRNKPGGSMSEILMFNDAISHLGLNEIPLQGKKFTWSNMQPSPLLEKIDWVFTNANWTLAYPNTSVKALDMIPSDHTPCLVNISTVIPKSRVFRFENFWLLDEQFFEILNDSWSTPVPHVDKAKAISAKFKILRKNLKQWHATKKGLHSLIANCRNLLLFLEILQEYRDLSLEEWDFQETLKEHLLGLLEKQRVYWKQRGSIKWVKMGDAGTKFFHANATMKYRKNLISELVAEDGSVTSDHREKERMLWEDFKLRLGVSECSGLLFDPVYFIHGEVNLETLELPFQQEEIDSIIRKLPNDKSPGPDGFNNEFLKKCWPVIRFDFYELCREFYDHSVCLRSINSSNITLIPKVDGARRVNEFRPISLLNSSIKLITKLLANRLQPLVTALVHRNQYGFIKKRSIQDCVAWAYEYIHLCSCSRKEIVILKLDFEKAFDKVEHQTMISLLEARGFGPRWVRWMQNIFSSGTSAVLLNGAIGKTFHCRRGVRQGDPLSPLLFVLAADLLQSMINKGRDLGLLRLPIPMDSTQDFPVVQYADDTLVIMEGDTRQLFFLKALLNSFSLSTGLKINFNKSMMIPINVPEDRLQVLAATFGCVTGSLPFTYLGLPLCISRPTVQDFLPMIRKCEKRLALVSPFLNQAGRLQMVNAVFSALPTFFMCSIVLPKSIIKQIDKYRKHCLWRGSSVNEKGYPKAAWDMVCIPKVEGGLGVLDLEKQNQALLMKNLHKFFNKHDIPWVKLIWEKHYSNGKLPSHTRKGSFWWRDILKLLSHFKTIEAPIVGNGESVLFWTDPWKENPICSSVPELYTFVKNGKHTMQKVINNPDFTSLLQLPISQIAFTQLQRVNALLESVELTENPDKWFQRGGSEQYSAKKTYRALCGHSDIHSAFKWLWKCRVQPKHKVFFGL